MTGSTTYAPREAGDVGAPSPGEEIVVIWSGERHCYWRDNAAGYTRDVARAGRYRRVEAERLTRHCGPEKKIQIQPAPLEARSAELLDKLVNAWASGRQVDRDLLLRAAETIREHDQRVTDLLEANNRYLGEARAARAETKAVIGDANWFAATRTDIAHLARALARQGFSEESAGPTTQKNFIERVRLLLQMVGAA